MVYQPTAEDLKAPCVVCKEVYNGKRVMLQCTVCANFIHLKCHGVKQTPKNMSNFICKPCQESGQELQKSIEVPEIRIPIEDDEEDLDTTTTCDRFQSLEALIIRINQESQDLYKEKSAEVETLKKTVETLSKQLESVKVQALESSVVSPIKARDSFLGEFSGGRQVIPQNNDGNNQNCLPSQSTPTLARPQIIQDNLNQNVNGMQNVETSNTNQLPAGNFNNTARPSFNLASAGDDHQSGSTSNYLRKQSLRKLPIFDGDIKVCPHFASAYRYSTMNAPFNNEENTQRLREFVKGPAYNLIEGFLMDPNGAPQAIDVLDQWFGDTIEIKDALKKELLEMPNPSERAPVSFRDFSAKLRTFVKFLEMLEDGPQQLSNNDTMRSIIAKLPPSMQSRWYDAGSMMDRKPTLADLDRFVTRIAVSYKNVIFEQKTKTNDKKPIPSNSKQHKVFVHQDPATVKAETDTDKSETSQKMSSSPDPYCHLCQKVGHKLEKCDDFKNLNLEKRKELARGKQLCLTCLRKRHTWKQCKRNKDKPNPELHCLLQEQKNENEKAAIHTSLSHYEKLTKRQVLFKIVPIVLSSYNKKINTFAILDDCSTITLMERNIADQLESKPVQSNVPMTIEWTQNTIKKLAADKHSLKISGRAAGVKQYKIKNIFAIPNLNLPCQSLDVNFMKQRYPYLEKADLENLENARPTILIGLEHTKLGSPQQVLEGKFSQPIATKSKLGWILYGPISSHSSPERHRVFLINSEEEENLQELVKFSFTTEALGTKPPGPSLQSINDAKANQIMESLAVRKGDRFEVPLLWTGENCEMPDSWNMAKWRLESLERKLDKNPELKRQYCDKIREYLEKDYAEKLDEKELKMKRKKIWYLPHFPVQTISKPKPRLVFDAAATVNNRSLNSFLLSGPDVYVQLLHVLLSQRIFKIAITADIKEMFHQVIIREEDRAAQRFLWRNCDSTKPIEVFHMKRMIFGATSSPFVAQWVKNRNAEEFQVEFPEAYEVILKNHYVDDFIVSFPTKEQAIRISTEVKQVHQRGGFFIRNFTSNDKEVQRILNEENDVSTVNLDKDPNEVQKVLGLHWDTGEDVYIFKNNYLAKFGNELSKRKPTKREFLRLLMSIFDPFGFVASFIVQGKMLLQDIWMSKIEWDQELCDEEYKKFLRWITDLEKITEFKLPRCISTNILEAESIEVHVLSDASESAFACVVYLRIVTKNNVEVSLIGAKTRVAPSRKTLSIPKLELQGFILGVRWVQFLLSALRKIRTDKIFHWTDSKCVLDWINSPTRKFNKFVETRISEILDYLEEKKTVEVRYVPSQMNVSDEATKYSKPFDISPTSNWIKGPQFLRESPEKWPKCNQQSAETETSEEVSIVFLHKIQNDVRQSNQLVEFKKYSNFGRLVKRNSNPKNWKR